MDARRSCSEDSAVFALVLGKIFGLPCSPLSRWFSSRNRWISSACSATLADRCSTRFIREMTTWRRPSSSMVVGSTSSTIFLLYMFPSGFVESICVFLGDLGTLLSPSLLISAQTVRGQRCLFHDVIASLGLAPRIIEMILKLDDLILDVLTISRSVYQEYHDTDPNYD